MRAKQLSLARFVAAVFVALSLAFLPMLSQQAMASHHATNEVKLDVTSDSHLHATAKSGSCAENSETQSTDLQMDCCDLSCSSFAAFEASDVLAGQLQVDDHFEIDAEQLTSRIVSGLKRPPRV